MPRCNLVYDAIYFCWTMHLPAVCFASLPDTMLTIFMQNPLPGEGERPTTFGTGAARQQCVGVQALLVSHTDLCTDLCWTHSALL